jgi:uncharacterized protein with ParB-like and HNH nuclease domain
LKNTNSISTGIWLNDMAKNRKIITDEEKLVAEAQIKAQQKETKYDLRDFTIDYIVQQFREDLFFIPEYQREFIWPENHRINFIESIILGLPIPMMFVADIEDGRLEIVDGAQRIQTLEQFSNGDLILKNLKILDCIEGFTIHDLSTAQQRKFNTKALRMVVLEDSTTESRRQEIFQRINTTSVKAKASEIRRSNYNSELMKLIIKLSENIKFHKACPLSKSLIDRREREELILRFFAYSNSYTSFKHDVGGFLDKYLLSAETNLNKTDAENEFIDTINFIDRFFPSGFAKTKTAKSTPRVRFEAIAVGVNLALRESPSLNPKSMDWLESKEFLQHTTTHASNSGPKLIGRVEYVKNELLRS